MRHFSPKQRTPLREIVGNVGRDWYRVGSGPFKSGALEPEHDIRIVATGRLYRIGDLTYRLLKGGSEPTPEGWLELSEDGEPIDEDRAASAADASYQFQKERA